MALYKVAPDGYPNIALGNEDLELVMLIGEGGGEPPVRIGELLD
jgi:hypothetical protein